MIKEKPDMLDEMPVNDAMRYIMKNITHCDLVIWKNCLI